MTTDPNPRGDTPCAHCGCPYLPWPEIDWGGDEGPTRFYRQCRHCRAQTSSYEREEDASAAWARGETTIPDWAESVPPWDQVTGSGA